MDRAHFFLVFLSPEPAVRVVSDSLKKYRENRENGDNKQDDPKSPFPSFGLENITTYSDFDKAFSCESDKQRESPEKFKGPNGKNDNRYYWYAIKHKSSGTVLCGFSQEPAFEKGHGWYLYKFTDTHCPAIRQWMEEQDLNYLRRIQRENPALYQQEIADLKAKNPDHPAIMQFAEVQANEPQGAQLAKGETLNNRPLHSPTFFQPSPLPPPPPVVFEMRAAYSYQDARCNYLEPLSMNASSTQSALPPSFIDNLASFMP
jgi:hypothetical protein